MNTIKLICTALLTGIIIAAIDNIALEILAITLLLILLFADRIAGQQDRSRRKA